ncbi:MAG: preprotein translocase subunit SecA [Clostridia bacterium]|nr:preprotein translocase subunit SecA [Clostridia bacterium]
MGFFDKLFGSHSDRELKRIQPIVDRVLALEETYTAMSEEELKGQTAILKERLQQGETVDDILPEAFATIREAAWRVLGMKHYPVQIIGGIVLHQGRIAEMKTGEGKTLVATLPAYLNALTGNGVHVVTVNDYLAQRDSEWMGKVYRYLGLTVGLIINGLKPEEKKAAYAADITYGTNNEFGFDYLRDNMALYKENLVQRGHAFAIVDEVDSILIDEARTPLIISGQGANSTEMYQLADNFVKSLNPFKVIRTDDKADYDTYAKMEYQEVLMGHYLTPEQHAQLKTADYLIEEKSKHVTLTANGVTKAEQFFHLENYADPANMEISHHINQAMRARGLMHRDIDYVVKDGQVLIVDEFTGRIMYGRRYNQGLHQAIEAKERVTVEKESKTLASITLQNYFRLYGKLSGMTGTALTEEEEFRGIYALDVVEIPTNRPNIRIDHSDIVFKTEKGKFLNALQQIEECHAKGQPVLVGTISIEKSEILSMLLKKRGIPHHVLNAKHHEKEASIIAQAGKFGAVTIATNMAGRGTDIMLGGNAEFLAKEDLRKKGYEEEIISEATGYAETDNETILEARKFYQETLAAHKEAIKDEAERVREAGGLFILGTERHESRRIDNQLRGRAARQGDPGATRFYLSLEDDLMRLFGGERVNAMMNTLRLPEDMPIEAKLLTGVIEKSQERVEGANFARRKHVLEYDDVMNKQRELIYEQRRQVLDGSDLKDTVLKMMDDFIDSQVQTNLAGEDTTLWSFDTLHQELDGMIITPEDLQYTKEELMELDPAEVAEQLKEKGRVAYEAKEQELGSETMREAERVVLLRSVDRNWMEHIDNMDDLRQGIGLEAYGQRNPVVEFKFQSYDIFDAMIETIKENTVRGIFSLRLRKEEEVKREAVAKETGTSSGTDGTTPKKAPEKVGKKVGPNDPCPCGSGKKYKKCCGDPAKNNQ